MANISELHLPDGTTKIIEDGTLWSGHRAAWEALTTEEQSKFRYVMFDDDSETGETVDAVTDGDMRAVTSNAVYNALAQIFSGSDKIKLKVERIYSSTPFELKYNMLCFYIVSRGNTTACGYVDYNNIKHDIIAQTGNVTVSVSENKLSVISSNGTTVLHGIFIYC